MEVFTVHHCFPSDPLSWKEITQHLLTRRIQQNVGIEYNNGHENQPTIITHTAHDDKISRRSVSRKQKMLFCVRVRRIDSLATTETWASRLSIIQSSSHYIILLASSHIDHQIIDSANISLSRSSACLSELKRNRGSIEYHHLKGDGVGKNMLQLYFRSSHWKFLLFFFLPVFKEDLRNGGWRCIFESSAHFLLLG